MHLIKHITQCCHWISGPITRVTVNMALGSAINLAFCSSV